MSQKGILLAHKKSIQKNYKHLNAEQKKIIKAIEEKELAEKELYGIKGFFAKAPRKNGTVDWEQMTEKDLDIFDFIQKRFDKASKYLSKISDEKIEQAQILFKQTQFNYSQSF